MSTLADLTPDSLFANDFRIVRKLSAGGMGAIYIAEQLSTGRQRALKLMHPGLVGSPELRQKFAMEARVGARVASEHIVEVVAAGVDGEVPWLAMELLVGEDLSEVVAHRGAMPKEEVVTLLSQVCHGLAAAHAAGIVHRDLKPENIFLAQSRRAQEAFTVKLLDFGIAKVVEAARGSNTGAIGSPLWMAPEQTERDAMIAPSTDIWSLGLVAFFMLTGKVFWRASGEGALTAFLRELVMDPIPPASVRAHELGVAVPPGFDAWFGRCVVRERGSRFADVQSALASLYENLGVAPNQTAQIRVSTGGTPMTGAAAAELAQARTAYDTSSKKADAAEDEVKAVVPVGGPSPTLLIAVGVFLFLGIGGGALYLLGKKENRAGPDPALSGSASALPFCPKGTSRVIGGEFTMGSNAGPSEEQPEHPTKVSSFCLDVTEVTVGDYTECVGKKGCAAPKTVDWPGITKEDRDTLGPFCNFGVQGRKDHPINCISFEEAAAYCKYAGKRLPTEEQWEYAARGTENRAFPWGHESPTPQRLNGCDEGCARAVRRAAENLGPRLRGDDGFEATAPVGTFPEGVSPFGAFDMAGNVAEWTDAAFCPYGQNACGTIARVVRGGSWMSDTPVEIRTTARAKVNPAARSTDVGFRCVK